MVTHYQKKEGNVFTGACHFAEGYSVQVTLSVGRGVRYGQPFGPYSLCP